MPLSTDPQKQQKQLANLQSKPSSQPGNAALAHGGTSRPGIMRCCKCAARDECEHYGADALCKLEQDYAAARREALLTLSHIDPVIDDPAIGLLIWCEVRLLRVARYLDIVGETVQTEEGLDSQPIARRLSNMQNAWQRALKELGVTPAERKKLTDEGQTGPAHELANAIREITRNETAEQEQAVAVNAEFRPDEDGDPDD